MLKLIVYFCFTSILTMKASPESRNLLAYMVGTASSKKWRWCLYTRWLEPGDIGRAAKSMSCGRKRFE